MNAQRLTIHKGLTRILGAGSSRSTIQRPVKSYRKARENKRRQAEREEEEIEARARALASSPLIRDALKNMQHDDMIDPRAGRPDPLASLQQQTILEQTDEEDS